MKDTDAADTVAMLRDAITQMRAACEASEPEKALRKIHQIAGFALDRTKGFSTDAIDPSKQQINGHGAAAVSRGDLSTEDDEILDDIPPIVAIGNLRVHPLGNGFIAMVNGGVVAASEVVLKLRQDRRPEIVLAFTPETDEP